jgi:hypothetical protein
VLHRRGAELVGQALEQRLALGAVVAVHAHLDQAVRLQRGVDLGAHGRRQPLGADAGHRLEVMGIGALGLALGGGQEEGGHRPIIDAT